MNFICDLCKKEIEKTGSASMRTGEMKLYCDECDKVFLPFYEMVCDFCSQKPVKIEYMAKNFIAFDKEGIRGKSIGSWYACAVCDEIIERDARRELARRSVTMIGEGIGDRVEAERIVLELQRQFFVSKSDRRVIGEKDRVEGRDRVE